MKQRRIMAHKIDVGDREYRLSIAATDSRGYLLDIVPFRCETANTEFHNGTVLFRVISRRRLQRAKVM